MIAELAIFERDLASRPTCGISEHTPAPLRGLLMLRSPRLSFAAFCFLSIFGAAACSSDVTDDVGSSTADLVTLTAQQCSSPTVRTKPMVDGAGQAVYGTARTTVDGCVLGTTSETGASVLARAVTILSDPARLITLTDADGQRVFSRLTPYAPTTVANGSVQDVDVELDAPFSPTTRLRVTRREQAGSVSVDITNVTPLTAKIAFFPVTVTDEGGLSLRVRLGAEENGIKAAGVGEVSLNVQGERAAGTAQLIERLFLWLADQLTRAH